MLKRIQIIEVSLTKRSKTVFIPSGFDWMYFQIKIRETVDATALMELVIEKKTFRTLMVDVCRKLDDTG